MTTNSILSRFAIGTAAMGVGLAMTASLAAAENWDMPTPYPEGNFHTQNIIQFAEDVEEATNGELTITVHSNGSLIEHPEIKNAVRGGQVPAGEFLLSLLANENPVFQVDAVPFLATGYEEAGKLWEVSREKTEELLAQQNLKVLFAVAWPPQGIYSVEKLESIDDLSGASFRSYNNTTERLAQLAGAVPTQVEVPDLAQAFSTGRVEAMITSPSTGVNVKAWDFLDYYADTRAWVPKNIIVVNQDRFDALPSEIQEAVMAAAEEAEARGWEMSMEETETQTQALADNGIEVYEPNEELRASLLEIGETMSAEWAENAGEDGQKILDAFLPN